MNRSSESYASRGRIGLAALVSFLVFGTAAIPGNLPAPEGSVDWVGGHIEGVGHGTAQPSGNRPTDRLKAIRAAEVLAQRALAETIHGVRVDGETSMGDAVKRYVLESRVQGLVRGARKVEEKVTWDGDIPFATVMLRVCLAEGGKECRGVSSLVGILPAAERKEPAYVPAVEFGDGPPGGNGGEKAAPGDGKLSYDSSRQVTGLVLDLRSTGHVRELFPVLATIGEKGALETVFSAKRVRPEVIRTHGVARYADSVSQARGNPLVGDNPLVVAVAEVTQENLLVIRKEAARVIRETTRYGNDYLANAKVIIAGGR